MQTLDVRPLAPKIRHETIFERIDELATGETLRLVNDHDPAPLRYQLDATRPGQFRWTYVEQGPEEWAVDITSRARVVDARPTLAAGTRPATLGDLADLFTALAAHIEDEEMELFPAAMLGFEDDEWEATRDAHRAVDAGAAVVAT